MKKLVIYFLCIILSFQSFAQTPKKLENLGPAVNSKYWEVRPTISVDGKRLYFIVENHPQNVKYKAKAFTQDVWYSDLDSNGNWGTAKQVENSVNNRTFNTIFWLSPDGNSILIRGAFENGKYVGRGISKCVKTASGWGPANKLKIKDYDKMSLGIYSGAMLANDGKTLLMYFSEEKGSETNKVYVSFLQDNDEWTRPMDLGETINPDTYDVISPFLAADGVTMYFSSNRPGGFGKNDIWRTRRLDDSWLKWSEPVNLGSPINTPEWDAYFAIDASGKYAYLASTQNSLGGTDIVRTELDEKDRPDPVALLYGKVFNSKDKKFINADILYDNSPDGKNQGITSSSSTDGSYKIILPFGKKYTFRTNANQFNPIDDTVDLTNGMGYREIHRDLYLTPVGDSINDERYAETNKLNEKNIVNRNKNGDDEDPEAIKRNNKNRKEFDPSDTLEVGQTLTFKTILFDFNKSWLRTKSFYELDILVRLLKKSPNVKIEMSAHTDNVGSVKYNIALSKDRATAVKEYLVSRGIDKNRIISKGYGKSKPVATNKTAAGRQLNRRVEFTVLEK